jgi:hypothetical protein
VMRDADKESWDLFQQKKDLWLDWVVAPKSNIIVYFESLINT